MSEHRIRSAATPTNGAAATACTGIAIIRSLVEDNF